MAEKEYLMPSEDVISALGSSKDGLPASEVSSRLEKYGRNKLEEKKKDSLSSSSLFL